jgi:hypothetical protein
MTKSPPSWLVDPMIRADRSVDHYTNSRRKLQHQIGRKMARKRLLDNLVTASSSSTKRHNGILTHHSPNVYLGEGGYCNCSFLDGSDLILAVSIHGEIDVFQLPRYNDHRTDDETRMTQMALKVQLNDDPSYDCSISTHFKLKPLHNGQAFAVGSPSGSFSIFATEHVSTWSTAHLLPNKWRKNVRQQPLIRNDNALSGLQSTPWTPFITQQWRFCMELQHHQVPRGMLPVFATRIPQQKFAPQTRPDALWDFQECSSGLLAAHHVDGVVRLLDSRTVGNNLVSSIGTEQRGNYLAADKKVTALCFASELSLLTADALSRQSGKIENLIHTWDLRKTASPINSFTTYIEDGHVSLLTPSAGKVMVTCSLPPSDLQHFWFDLGRQKAITRDSLEIPASVHSKHVNMLSSPFAVNPNQDFMACYERSTKTMKLFDLESGNMQVSRKRGLDDEHRPNASADKQGFECVASFQPTILDRYGLTSELACMAMNDLGTAIVGGSGDGDLYAWRGS